MKIFGLIIITENRFWEIICNAVIEHTQEYQKIIGDDLYDNKDIVRPILNNIDDQLKKVSITRE